MIDLAAHDNAFKGLLTARPALASKVYPSVRENNGVLVRDVYVIVYATTPEVWADDRYAKNPDGDSYAEFVYTVRSVAPTPEGVTATRQHVLTALMGQRPTVAGRVVDPLRHERGDRVEADNSISPPLFYADDDFLLVSRRA